MRFDIGGTTAATVFQAGAGYHDTIIMNGGNTIFLNGLLEVNMIDGFASTISNSDTFNIINAGVSGAFTNLVGGRITTAGNEGSFLVSAAGSGLQLSDWQAVPIPEPGTYALLAGLLGLSCVMMRRRK
jgi:hypothetical protein